MDQEEKNPKNSWMDGVNKVQKKREGRNVKNKRQIGVLTY